MKKKNIIKISAIVFSIILVIVAITTTTQSYFNKDNYAKNPTEYQTGLLSIEAISKSNNISLSNTLPMSDAEGEQTDPYVFTIRNNGNVDYKFNVKLLSTSDNTFSPEYIKIKIDDEEVKTLSSLTDSVIKKDIILPAGETVDITLRVWLSSTTKNTEIGKTFNSKIVIDGQSIYTSSNTDIKDFTYFLGSEYSEVDTINYYNEEDGNYYDISIIPIPLESNEILLTKYNGTNKNVTIPDTYTVDGTTYNVVILSWVYLNYNDGDLDTDDGIFINNMNIENVYLNQNIKSVSSGTDEYYENDAQFLFLDCTSLVNAPEIPSGVTNMSSTFNGCTSLVNAPEIPSGVTNMSSTFNGCTSLVNAPKIPSSVTNISYTFNGCTSLVNAPTIPNSVTSMTGTFQNCANLTGTVKINSSNVSYVSYIFHGTTKSITVQVPSGSTTYTKMNALTTSNGKPSNVTLTTY